MLAWPTRSCWCTSRAPACSVNAPLLLIEAVKVEGFGGGGMVAAAFGDVQVADVFDGRDDGGADGGQVGGPLPVRLVAVSSLNVVSRSFSRGGARPAELDLRVSAGQRLVMKLPEATGGATTAWRVVSACCR
jgi:hypothetical protein